MSESFNTYQSPEESARQEYNARTEEAMRANGQQVEEKVEFIDYFTFEESIKHFLPDGKHYIEFKPMTEGVRRKYQSRTQPTITSNRASGDSKIGINIARDREHLLNESVVGWFMEMRDGMGNIVEVRFDDKRNGWLAWQERANPKLIEDLEKAIRKANPWMQSDMDIKEVDEEIERLQTLRTELLDRELGESASSDK